VLDAFGPQPVLVTFAAVQTVAMLLVAGAAFAARASVRAALAEAAAEPRAA
jgi:hypothetical protein